MPLPDCIRGGAHELGISADLVHAFNRAIFTDNQIHKHTALNTLLFGFLRIERLDLSNQILSGSSLWEHDRLRSIGTSLCRDSRNRYVASGSRYWSRRSLRSARLSD